MVDKVFIFIVVVFAIVGMFYGTLQVLSQPENRTKVSLQSPLPSSKPRFDDLLVKYPKLSQTLDPEWQKISIETTFTSTPGSQIGPSVTHITAKIPPSWNLTVEKSDLRLSEYNHNCSKYAITSPDKITRLTLQLICGGWSVKQTDILANSIVVTRDSLRANDGPHIVSRLRVPGRDKNYSYFDGMVWIDNNGSVKNQVGDVLMLRYPAPDEEKYDHWWQPAQLSLDYSGPDTEKDKNLQISDKIASSFYLE